MKEKPEIKGQGLFPIHLEQKTMGAIQRSLGEGCVGLYRKVVPTGTLQMNNNFKIKN